MLYLRQRGTNSIQPALRQRGGLEIQIFSFEMSLWDLWPHRGDETPTPLHSRRHVTRTHCAFAYGFVIVNHRA
ncbi:hypothetical protein EVAR_45818_1 [Eumeta japonica]|uniref:Uncharacterized protein n=1 Tax=Eumeta variegata TaxID=151549 RepID=A0A4C1WNT2_EUMVA|nr:hypothetical protein EVAR_45818_1 [Eumeta japonica]